MGTSVVIVDSRVTDYQTLIDGLSQPAEVLVLNTESDGLSQIATYLQGRSGIDALHIISHGSQGALQLGSTVLDSANLGYYGSQLANIGSALTSTGDILLYGCNVAQGDVGVQFISSLAQYTGADIAASTNLTGAVGLGGDWVLEAIVGSLNTSSLTVGNAYQSTLQSSTTQLTFAANSASLWGPGSGTSFSTTLDWLVFHQTGVSASGSPSVNVLGAQLGLDYALNVGDITYGFPIDLGFSAGVFNLNYPFSASISLPSTVKAGDTFTVTTAGGISSNPTMAIDGPSVNVSMDAEFLANISGHLGLTWSGIPLVDNGHANFFGTSQDGLTYTDTSIPIAVTSEVFSTDSVGKTGLVLNNNLTWSSETLGGRKVFRNPFITVGFEADLNGLDGNAKTVVGTDALTDMVAIVHQDKPMLSITADLDDIIGKLMEMVPATAAYGELVRRLDQEYRSKLNVIGIDLGSDYDASLVSIDATFGISPALKVTFDATDVLVTLTASTGETHTGHVGDAFQFTAPGNSSTPLNITSSYQLQGNVKTEVGIVMQGEINLKLLGAEGKAFGIDIPAFFPDTNSDAKPDNYLVDASWPQDNRLGNGWFYSLPTFGVTYDAGQSTYAISYGAQTDAVVSPTITINPTLSVQIVGANSSVSTGAALVTEGNTGSKSIVFHVTRSGNLNQATSANYSFTFGTDVDAVDFGGTLPVAGTLQFGVGETAKDVTISIAGDSTAEIDEKITFNLTSSVRVVNPAVTLTIYSDDQHKVTGTGIVFGTSRDDLVLPSNGSTVYAGAGNDGVNVVAVASSNQSETVDGGSGFDTLNVDLTVSNAQSLKYVLYSAAGVGTTLDYSSSSGAIQTALGAQDATAKTNLHTGSVATASYFTDITTTNVEVINVTGTACNVLLIYKGGTTYDCKAGADTFYADWSAATTDITWNNDPTKTQTVNGVSVAGLERLLIQTGSGNDTISNALVATDDQINTGTGNDTISAGGGNDTLTGGVGRDVFEYAASGNGNDMITDFTTSDVIRIAGAALSGVATAGSGSSIGLNAVQVSTGSTTTTLSIGTNSTAGAEVVIVINGVFTPDRFVLSGTDVSLSIVPNQAPTVANPLADGVATQDVRFTVQVASNAFADKDVGDTLTYTATVAGGSALSAWLSFDAQTRTFAGTPRDANVGSITVRVTATDSSDASAYDDFVINVANVNDTPTGTVTISGTPAQGQTLTVANALADIDGLGTISYQWRADGATIAGATTSSFYLTESQVGKVMTVDAAYVDGHGTAESVSSSGTPAVANVNDPGFVSISGTPTEGQTLLATLLDADGLGTVNYQWRADGAAISNATASTFVMSAGQVGKAITVTASYTDAHGTLESVTGGFGKTVDLMTYSWRTHTLLDSVSVSATNQSASTNASGAASFTAVTDTSLTLTASRVIPPAEATATSSAVNLQDAIAILKMIVGLPVNGANQALSPYQALAADFDANGTVGLTDAIGVLKHVVGLTAPEPTWHFVSEADTSVPAKTTLNPGTPQATVTADLSGTSPVHVGLAGYLSGDVDGSYAGAAGALDLDVTQPTYIATLVASHPGLTAAQFGG